MTVRGGAHEAKVAGSNAAPPAAKPYRAKPPGLVLAATHHKTGQWHGPCSCLSAERAASLLQGQNRRMSKHAEQC